MNLLCLMTALLLACAHAQFDYATDAQDEDENAQDENAEDENAGEDPLFKMGDNDEMEATFSGTDEDPTIMEGDIVVNPKLMAEIGEMEKMASDGTQMYDAIKRGTWPKGEIPYTVPPGHEDITPTIRKAADHFRSQVGNCINWKEYDRKTITKFHPFYVTFYIGRGCFSMIGRQGRPQQISLGRGCNQVGTAIHEMMHALGFFHEQSRLDRDNFITINWSYIPSGLWYNFKKYQPGSADTFGEPYDKDSIMHYGNYAFSTRRGQKTIVSRSDPNESLGQRKKLSTIDIKQLKKYYKCRDTGTGTGTVTPTSSCADSKPYCIVLGNYCADTWVKTNCKKKCGQCADDCKDTSTYAHNCPRWAGKYCNDGKYKSWMEKHCKKTCKKC